MAKKELAVRGYPLKETIELAEQLYEKGKVQFNKIPPDSAIVVMGSTTGKNIIPYLLSEKLKEQRPGLKIYNTKGQYVALPSHRGEGKNKSNYQERVNDQRAYKIVEGPLLEKLKKEPVVIILDDVISSGESGTVLKKQLIAEGVKVKAIAAPLTSSRSLASENDIKRLTDKLMEQKPEGMSERKLKEDIRANFEGYPRRKIGAFTADLSRRHLQDPELRFQIIARGAQYNRELEKSKGVQVNYKELYQNKVKANQSKEQNQRDVRAQKKSQKL